MIARNERRFHIRRATPKDALGILRTHVDSIRRVCSVDYTPEQIEAWARPKKLEHYTQALACGDTLFVAVAGDDDAIVGFGSAQGDEVTGVYVALEFLRSGVGRALLAAVEDDARERGVRTMTLDASLTAIAFYRSQGWQVIEHSNFRLSGSVEIACAKMTKAL